MRSVVPALLALAACHPHAPAAPTPPPTPPDRFDVKAIDAYVAAEVAHRGVVGAALVIVKNGETVLAKGYGTRKIGEELPIDPDATPFGIGSVSKEFTCAAAMSLVDEGKLSMDGKVATWYPSLGRADQITLDDLGAHESGYPDYYPLDYLDARMKTPIAPDDLLARYAKEPLDFAPRARWSYSNTGFVLLARVVERVAGVPLAQLLSARIFQPLAMTHTTQGPPPDGSQALGHDSFFLGDQVPTAPEASGWLFGDGDLYASAGDLARWDLGFIDGKVLSDASRAYMTTAHHTTDGRSTDYGCGLDVAEKDGEIVVSHGGEVEGYLAYNTFVPRTRSAVVLLVDDEAVDLSDVNKAIVGLVLDQPEDVPEVAGPSAVAATSALFAELQRGKLDRSVLGDDFSAYLDDARVAAAAPRLRALGTPKVTLLRQSERGGMEVSVIDLAFPSRDLTALLYRSPDGKIHELLLLP